MAPFTRSPRLLKGGLVNFSGGSLGVDSLQALLLALQKAEAVLRHLSRQGGWKLTWLGHDDGLTGPA